MVRARDIASFLGCDLQGRDVDVRGARFIDNIEEGTVVFASAYTDELCAKLNAVSHDVMVIAHPDYHGKLSVPHVLVPAPRVAFTKVYAQFWVTRKRATGIEPTAVVHPTAIVPASAYIGHFAVIEADVVLGENTSINGHTVVHHGVTIGRNCAIETHCTIGQPGWWFTLDEKENRYIDLPHEGGVRIGDYVHIGSYTNIDRAIFAGHHTIVEDGVRVNDKVHVSHGVWLRKNARIAVGAHVCGESDIGDSTWIGPGAVVKNSVKIAPHVTVGMNAVVTKSISVPGTYVGVPARANPQLRRL